MMRHPYHVIYRETKTSNDLHDSDATVTVTKLGGGVGAPQGGDQ